MKIVAYGASLKNNFGGPSLLYGACEIWKDQFPDLEIVFIDRAYSKEAEIVSNKMPVKVIVMPPSERPLWLLTAVIYKLFGKVFNQTKRELLQDITSADVVIDLWGIAFSDKLGVPRNWFRIIDRYVYLITSKLLKKKFVKYTSSFGPIHTFRTKHFARLFLGKMTDQILCREQESQKALKDLGINIPMQVCPDTALAMKPESIPDRSSLELFGAGPVIAVSISHQIIKQWDSSDGYINMISSLIQDCIDNFNGEILLIPNEIGFPNDDISVAESVRSKCAQKDRIHILSIEELSAPQLKYIISQCEIMLASRYHSIVAAMSSAVPTLVIGWHYKYEELLAHFQQNEYSINCQQCSTKEVKQKLQSLWESREQIRCDLAENNKSVQQQLAKGSEVLASLIGC